MKIVAIKECASGNESVGEMWKETKIFEDTVTLKEVMSWTDYTRGKNIILSIPDGEIANTKDVPF